MGQNAKYSERSAVGRRRIRRYNRKPRDDIKFLTQRLRPGSETKLADLGCGSGCVGRYLAKEFDTEVEGIDASPLAIRMADELAVTSGTAQRLRFKTGDISKTGWSDRSFDGALSMDVLLFVPDKRAAFARSCSDIEARRPFRRHDVGAARR